MRLPPAAAALLRLRNGSTGLTGRAGSINRAGLTDSACSAVGDEAAQVLGDRLRRPRPGPHAEGTGRTVCRLVDRRRPAWAPQQTQIHGGGHDLVPGGAGRRTPDGH